MSMAEYMYKLLYGRKLGRAHLKGRHVNYISSSCSYGGDAIECNRSCSYAQTPYSGGSVTACHEVCPSWFIENNVYNSATEDDKRPRTPTSTSTTCQTPWWATGGSAVYPVDREGFYLQGTASEEFPSAEVDVASITEAPPGGNRKNCRFSTASDSAESCSDDPPKFSHTLQFQISQHLWENLALDGTPIDGDTISLQTQGVATGPEYLQYAGNADGSYLSSCSSASSSSLQTHYNLEVPYPYSPCRESNLSLGMFANDFQQTDFLYRATVPESEKAEELSTLGYQRWNALCEQYCCCAEGSLYSCPLASGQKLVSNDGLYVGDREAGYNMVSSAYDVKPEVKGIGRRMRCQMTSPAEDGGRVNSFSVAGRNSSRPPYFSIAATPISSAISSSSSASSSAPQETPVSMVHTSAAVVASTSSSTSCSKGLLMRPEGKLRESNQMCAVCGDNAACQHYGVRTCEGCKGFFKRTVQKGSKYVCLSGKNCPIDKRRRNRCQFCRFQKCLTVGMVKEVVRTDSLKGRRGRLPSKAKNTSSSSSSSSVAPVISVQQQQAGVRSSPSAPTPQHSLLTGLLRAHVDTSPDLLNLDYSLYRASSDEDDMNQTTPEAIEQLYELLLESANTIRSWAESIPGVRQLTREDQETLVKGSLLELIVLRTSFGVELNDDRIIFPTGLVLRRDQCIAGFGAWIDRIIDFGRSMKSMEIDLPTMACLTALVLLKARRDLHEPATVEVLYSNFKNVLRDHCHSQGKHHLLPAIIAKLAELKTVCTEGVARLATLKSIMEPPTSSPFDQLCSAVDSLD